MTWIVTVALHVFHEYKASSNMHFLNVPCWIKRIHGHSHILYLITHNDTSMTKNDNQQTKNNEYGNHSVPIHIIIAWY